MATTLRTPSTDAAIQPVEVRQVRLRFAETQREVLRDVSLTVRSGEFACIIGPSGSGKTTLLRLIAGLVRPSAGEILIDRVPVNRPHPDIAFVFQDYGRALCPWRSVIRNVELPLEAARVPRHLRHERARAALDRVHLTDHDRDYPRQLSGGMQQRVQIARAIAAERRILLMDEPFASLDALTRFRLEDTTLRLWDELSQTVIHVTHDIDEALYLADRILVLGSNPPTVVGELPVELPRPRDQAETRADPLFVELRHELFARIRELDHGNIG